MNIDTIMHPAQPTRAQLAGALAATAAIAETIRELGSVPSGHLYAKLVGRLSLDAYQSIIRTLVNARLVRETGHELTWIGPNPEAHQ
jgi:hypothetical protein